VRILEGCFLAFAIAVVTTPAGVSGAVLLLPVQVSILNVPSPGVTPTNLLYNIVATPGGLLRYWRAGTLRSRLARTLALGTLPGVIVGAVIRVELLSGPRAFLVVVAVVLAPLGAWLATIGSDRPRASSSRAEPSDRVLMGLALAVGVIGGVYGVGGGSILALGFTMGLAGLVGSYVGAHLQARRPEALIRRLLGVLVLVIAVRYLFEGLAG
jgi:uncharacterized membrane protein YfcA